MKISGIYSLLSLIVLSFLPRSFLRILAVSKPELSKSFVLSSEVALSYSIAGNRSSSRLRHSLSSPAASLYAYVSSFTFSQGFSFSHKGHTDIIDYLIRPSHESRSLDSLVLYFCSNRNNLAVVSTTAVV